MPTDSNVELDMNNPEFQDDLFALPKPARHSVMETLKKIRQMTWNQVYRDHGLKWERLSSVPSTSGVSALYSIRLSQSMRAVCYREGKAMKLVSIPPDHDATYGKK